MGWEATKGGEQSFLACRPSLVCPLPLAALSAQLLTPSLPPTALLGYSTTLSERPPLTTLEEESKWVEPEAVSLLKRSCVRLIAIVSAEQKEAQDAVREAGGINLILGMCQINDANLSEWAVAFWWGKEADLSIRMDSSEGARSPRREERSQGESDEPGSRVSCSNF